MNIACMSVIPNYTCVWFFNMTSKERKFMFTLEDWRKRGMLFYW